MVWSGTNRHEKFGRTAGDMVQLIYNGSFGWGVANTCTYIMTECQWDWTLPKRNIARILPYLKSLRVDSYVHNKWLSSLMIQCCKSRPNTVDVVGIRWNECGTNVRPDEKIYWVGMSPGLFTVTICIVGTPLKKNRIWTTNKKPIRLKLTWKRQEMAKN
jgi:hypothetical protein